MLRRVATMREHHLKAPAEQSPGEGTMFIEQFTTYLLKGELGFRTDEITQDQIPNSINDLIIKSLMCQLMPVVGIFCQVKLINLVLSERMSEAK